MKLNVHKKLLNRINMPKLSFKVNESPLIKDSYITWKQIVTQVELFMMVKGVC